MKHGVGMMDDAKRPARPRRKRATATPASVPKRTLPTNQFRHAAKMDETTLIRLVFCFCNGIPVRAAAASVNVSAKTVRGIYIDLRRRLTKQKFNRWHAAYRRLLNLPSVEREGLVRAAFIDTLVECGLNEACYRNYQLGNRKSRLCRACPLPKRFSSSEQVREALDVIDAVHALYNMLGIRGETDIDPLVLFRLRLIHTTTIATARKASCLRPNELAKPVDRTPLSVATLLDVMLAALAMHPL